MKPLIVSTGDALSLHPGDVVRLAVAGFAGLVERDQRLERIGHRRGRERNRRLEMTDDRRRSGRCSARRPGRPLRSSLPFSFHEPRVERVLLVESVEVLHRDARVEVVGARGEDVLAGRRRLRRHHRIHVRDRRTAAAGARAAGRAFRSFCARKCRAGFFRRVRRGGKRLRRAGQHELARGEVVVRSGVDPEQFRVALDVAAASPDRRRPRCVTIASSTSRISRLWA